MQRHAVRFIMTVARGMEMGIGTAMATGTGNGNGDGNGIGNRRVESGPWTSGPGNIARGRVGATRQTHSSQVPE